jgi:hypothetical protein
MGRWAKYLVIGTLLLGVGFHVTPLVTGVAAFQSIFTPIAIQPIDGARVSVTHVEDIHGLLAPLFSVLMGAAVARSQQALNAALRARAESTQ